MKIITQTMVYFLDLFLKHFDLKISYIDL